MSFSFDVEKEIVKRYGAIKRARGCFLYTQNGARLVDMYLDGGRAVLGHGGGKARLMFKNALERGVTFSFSRSTPAPLNKALHALLPDYEAFYVFTSNESFNRAAESARNRYGMRADAESAAQTKTESARGEYEKRTNAESAAQTALGMNTGGTARADDTNGHAVTTTEPDAVNEFAVPRFMPWLSVDGSLLCTAANTTGGAPAVCVKDSPVIEVTVPFAWKGVRILALKRTVSQNGAADSAKDAAASQNGAADSAAAHATKTTAFDSVNGATDTAKSAHVSKGGAAQFCIQSDPLPPPLTAAITRAVYDVIAELPNRCEKDFARHDAIIAPYWERIGCYLFPRIEQSAYADFFIHCLNCGILVSPFYNVPSIVPFGAGESCLKSLERAPFVSKSTATEESV